MGIASYHKIGVSDIKNRNCALSRTLDVSGKWMIEKKCEGCLSIANNKRGEKDMQVGSGVDNQTR